LSRVRFIVNAFSAILFSLRRRESFLPRFSVFHYFLEVPALGGLFAGPFEQQASAAAEGMPLSVFLQVSWRLLVPTRLPACSDAVEDLDSPQHDDNGRYQRGHRQYTL